MYASKGSKKKFTQKTMSGLLKRKRKPSFSSKNKKVRIIEGGVVSLVSNLPTECWSSEWSALKLSEVTMKGIQSMRFSCPTDIQKAVIPCALHDGLDVLGAAETGSGKTLAFAIPIFEKWLQSIGGVDNNQLFSIIITPTRELAVQVHKQLVSLSAFSDAPRLRSMVLFGGMSQEKQQRLLKKKPHVIVATPGRLWALIETGEEHLEDLSTIKVLVVDEIDRMLEKGHFQELQHIVLRIHAEISGESDEKSIGACDDLQTLIFSATLTFTHQSSSTTAAESRNKSKTSGDMKIRQLTEVMLMRDSKRSKIVDLTQKNVTPASLVETQMHCANLLEKDSNLYYVLSRYGGRTLVFTNSIDAARRLYNLFGKLKHQPTPLILHAKMQESKRLKNLEKFTAMENSILLATDVAARGLDIAGVENVIHYQVPRTAESYVHRSGRTARALKPGLSVLFLDPLDVATYKRVKRSLNWEEDLEVLSVDSPKLMEACAYRIKLATDVEHVDFQYKKSTSRNEWFKKLAEEADLILEDEFIDKDEENGCEESPAEQELRLKRKKLEKSLNAVLRQPLPKPQNTSTTMLTKSKTNSTEKGESLPETGNEIRQKLALQKKPIESLKRHFKKRKRVK